HPGRPPAAPALPQRPPRLPARRPADLLAAPHAAGCSASSGSSEVEAGLAVAEPVGGHGVDVALAHDHVELATDLDLGLVLGVEQHPVTRLDGAHVRTDGDDPAPLEPPGAHRGRGRDDDAARGSPLAALGVDRDQDAVVEHPDRGPVPADLRGGWGPRHGQRVILRSRTMAATTPTTPPATLRMLSVRGDPSGATKWAFRSAICRDAMVLGFAR